MKPQKRDFQGKLFETKLDELVDKSHPLVRLRGEISWERFEEKFGATYCPDNGRPALGTRLLVGLTLLKYLNDLSDEDALLMWLENPYWQYFCGEEHFQHRFPFHPTNLSRWRRRMGEDGARELLQESLAVAKGRGALKMSYLEEVYVDTTVQEKNITYPTDAKLLHRSLEKLVKLSKQHGLQLRQSYKRVAKIHYIMACRYANANQYNRMRRQLKKLRTFLGRVVREVERITTEAQKPYFQELLELCKKVLDRKQIYSLHEPHTECIAKGKAHKKYEYGVKVSVVTTRKKGFVLDCCAEHGNPYDGHTLQGALDRVKILVGQPFSADVGVDLGYRGHGIEEHKVFHPRLKKLSRSARLFVRGRSKVEAVISLLKRRYRLGRNYLKGIIGDKLNSLLAGAAYNLGIVLRST